MARIAIVGTGIAGLGCAYFLRNRHELTLFDHGNYVGGHTNTIAVKQGHQEVSFDTGFMVFNKVTYPHLTRLFDKLEVAIQPTSMSFSVQHRPTALEFCGSSINHLFAQRRNIFRPGYWHFLTQISRFNREAAETLEKSLHLEDTVAEYVEAKGYGEAFLNYFLIPMSSAVWSTPPDKMLKFPITSLLRFFHNHGFLGLHTQHPWFSIQGGSQKYVRKILSLLPNDCIKLECGVLKVRRKSNGVELTLNNGASATFDKVILACHADQSLKILDEASAREVGCLDKFHYQPNQVTVHTDILVMPQRKLCWASWNYRIDSVPGQSRASTHYWMNSLQGLSQTTNYFVSLNYEDQISPEKVLRRIHYEHPLFDLSAMQAQKDLSAINRQHPDQTIYFCGSYTRYGFHEDGLASAVDVSSILLQQDPWTS